MKARLLMRTRMALDEHSFMAQTIWLLPTPSRGSRHLFKYSMAYIEHGICVVRFDNEPGKGDHMHVGDVESPYDFIDEFRLIADFQIAVQEWRSK